MSKECGNLKNWKKYIKENSSRKEIKNWRQDIRKSTTTRSMIGKRKPKWENYMTGNEAAVALFKLRAGDWDMWERRSKWGKNSKECRICGGPSESIVHLMTECEIMGKPDIFKKDRYTGMKGMKRILGIGMKLKRENWVSRKIFARNIMKALKGVEPE